MSLFLIYDDALEFVQTVRSLVMTSIRIYCEYYINSTERDDMNSILQWI